MFAYKYFILFRGCTYDGFPEVEFIERDLAVLRLLWVFAGRRGPGFGRGPELQHSRHGGPGPLKAAPLRGSCCHQEEAHPLGEPGGVAGPGADGALAGDLGAASSTRDHPGERLGESGVGWRREWGPWSGLGHNELSPCGVRRVEMGGEMSPGLTRAAGRCACCRRMFLFSRVLS